MLLHPEVVKKAQGELDDVVGRGRLPTFQDEEALPYVRALIKEIERFDVRHWHVEKASDHGLLAKGGGRLYRWELPMLSPKTTYMRATSSPKVQPSTSTCSTFHSRKSRTSTTTTNPELSAVR